MGLVICPECSKEVSQYAESCPACGFPIKKFMDKNKLFNTNSLWICPTCANEYFGETLEVFPPNLKCTYCHSIFIQTSENANELYSLHILKKDAQLYRKKIIQISMRYGNNQFDEHAYDNRIQILHKEVQSYIKQIDSKNQQSQQSNQPKCPTCGSVNIKKISTAKKAAGGFMFGLFSKTAKGQFQCKDCGYKW